MRPSRLAAPSRGAPVPPPAQLVDTVAEHLAQPLDVVEDAGVEVVVELALRL
jgi:hypothetical protein